MATRMADGEPRMVITPKKAGAYTVEGFRRHVARGFYAAGVIFLVGTVLDLAILWVFQRQPGPQWEFSALASTAEGLPRLVLAIALLYGGLYTAASTSLLSYRFLALIAILIALAGAAVGGLMLSDFFVLRRQVSTDGLWIFRSAVLKTLVLCGMYVFVLFPLGVLGLRRPRS